jgi:hypothetical protein
VALPLAVCVGLNVPQELAGVHDQSTPAPAESFCTKAVSEAVLPTCKEEGGAVWKLTAIIGGVVPGPEPDPPPHATRAEIKLTPMSRSIDCLVFILCPLLLTDSPPKRSRDSRVSIASARGDPSHIRTDPDVALTKKSSYVFRRSSFAVPTTRCRRGSTAVSYCSCSRKTPIAG